MGSKARAYLCNECVYLREDMLIAKERNEGKQLTTFVRWLSGRAMSEGEELPYRKHSMTCAFCAKDRKEVSYLISGPAVYICNECVYLCEDILIAEERKKTSWLRRWFNWWWRRMTIQRRLGQ
jgi:C4-type Zn-finger protein